MSALTRRGVIASALALPAARALADEAITIHAGSLVQGGAVIGAAAPRAEISLDGEFIGRASERGLYVLGFDRDAKPQARLGIVTNGVPAEHTLTIAPADYDVQRIDGLPQQTVTPEGEAVLAKIAAEAERKREGFASNVDADWFADGFWPPLTDYVVSGRFGGQRVLNGTPSTPHYGTDLAAPQGARILSPARGQVSFAETGLHYEGGLVLIDHGQGLVSAYLHMSQVDVAKGQMVQRGQVLGLVGAEGRATGPHLCWRLKWRGRNLDPTRLIGVSAAVLAS